MALILNPSSHQCNWDMQLRAYFHPGAVEDNARESLRPGIRKAWECVPAPNLHAAAAPSRFFLASQAQPSIRSNGFPGSPMPPVCLLLSTELQSPAIGRMIAFR